jgi:hypothetical protein
LAACRREFSSGEVVCITALYLKVEFVDMILKLARKAVEVCHGCRDTAMIVRGRRVEMKKCVGKFAANRRPFLLEGSGGSNRLT